MLHKPELVDLMAGASVIQYIKDLILEIRISITLNQMMAKKDRHEQRFLAKRMANLISQRSRQQVERMERRMGLK